MFSHSLLFLRTVVSHISSKRQPPGVRNCHPPSLSLGNTEKFRDENIKSSFSSLCYEIGKKCLFAENLTPLSIIMLLLVRNMVPFSSIIKKVWKDAFFVVKAYCVLHVTENYLITLVKTEGASMLPTIDSTPSMFLAERISPRFGKVAHGDIIRLRSPQNPRESYGKRVIGLEGDSITYVADRGNGYKLETVVVPKGHVWVEGDNKFSSYDSRSFGPVPYGLIDSKIFWRVWPRKDFGSFWNK